jgi:ornithine--oxo-acid transaminase
MITDEVQTGFGRTGKLMGYDWEGIKPDIVAVGKALSGGMMPVSGAFCNDKIMLCIKPGEHGSTYGGNPLGMAVAKTAIQVLIEEGMVENALKMGEILHEELSKIDSKIIKETRGRGLFRAIEVANDARVNGNDFAYKLMEQGILTKATHDYSLRLAPPLVINEKQVREAARKIKKAVAQLEKLNRERRKEAREQKNVEKEQRRLAREQKETSKAKQQTLGH